MNQVAKDVKLFGDLEPGDLYTDTAGLIIFCLSKVGSTTTEMIVNQVNGVVEILTLDWQHSSWIGAELD